MVKALLWLLFVSLGEANISTEFENDATTRLKRSNEIKPAFCPLGRYGMRCNSYCRDDCPGHLCSSEGECFYGSCKKDSVWNKIEGCLCSHNWSTYNCRFAFEPVKNIRLEDAGGGSLKPTFSFGSNSDEEFVVDWLLWRKDGYEEGRMVIRGNSVTGAGNIPLAQDCSYVVCVAVKKGNFLPNPGCIHYETPCTASVKTFALIRSWARGHSGPAFQWTVADESRQSRFLLLLKGRNWLCGKGNFSSPLNSLSDLERWDFRSLRGKWTFCLKKQDEPELCNGLEKCTKEMHLGDVSTKVQNLVANSSEKSVTLLWMTPVDWIPCSVSYLISRTAPGEAQQDHKYSDSNCDKNFRCVYRDNTSLRPDTNYTFQVTALFEKSSQKRVSTVTVKTLPQCPTKVNDIWIEESTTSVRVKWSDSHSNLNYTLTKEANSVCLKKDFNKVPYSSHAKEATFEDWDPFANTTICIQPQNQRQCSNEECKFFPPQQNISSSVADLHLTASESSAELHWTIPEDWTNKCMLKKFAITTTPRSLSHLVGRVSPPSEQCNDRKCSYELIRQMTPGISISFEVVATFENNRRSAPALVQGSPLPKGSDGNYKVLSKDQENDEVFVIYDFQDTSMKQVEFCRITAKVHDAETEIFNCSDAKGKIKNSDLKSGAAYEVTFKICIEKWCTESANPLKVFTPPEKPRIRGSIRVLFSNDTHLQLKLPTTGQYSNGSIFVFVAMENPSLNEENLISYLRDQSLRRTKRIVPAKIGRTGFFFDTLALKTTEYMLSKSSLVGEDKREEIEAYACCLFQFKSGKYETYAATGFQGPFFFGESKSTAQLLGISFASILSIFTIFIMMWVLLYFIRISSSKKDKKSQVLQAQSQPDMEFVYSSKCIEPDTGSLRKHENPLTLEIPPVGPTPLTASTEPSPQDVASLCPKLRLDSPVAGGKQDDEQGTITRNKLERPTLLFPCDPLTPTPVDNEKTFDMNPDYTNIEPELSFREGLERYLIRVAFSQWIEREFKSIPMSNEEKSTQEGQKSGNRRKNRYQNNLPYDESRVCLPRILDDDTSSDYINASWVKIGVGKERTPLWHIATQGPLKKSDTISDFWRMVWYNDVEIIVMVTNLVENGKVKCDKYWPDEGEVVELKDEIFVEAEETEFNQFFLVRHFLIRRGQTAKQVVQYNYTEWPDHGAPLETSPLIHLLRRILSRRSSNTIVIHCSAGIGRTGVLLLVLMCLEEIENFDTVNIPNCLRTLRDYRPKLIQNTQQYIFVHLLLWSFLFNCEETIPAAEFEERVRDALAEVDADDRNGSSLADQYKRFKNYSRDLTHVKAMLPNIRHINRSVVFPADEKLVTFVSIAGSEEEKYLNAIRVDGFNAKDAYIVTEHPTLVTLGRVWFMILERQLPFWILLNEMDQDNEEYPPLLPTKNKALSFGYLTIRLQERCKYRHFTESKINIQANYQSHHVLSFDCRVIQFRGWIYPEISPRAGADGLFSLLSHLGDSVLDASPLLFTCADGYTACGAALGLDIAWRRAEQFHEVQIFSTCVGLTYSRPEFIVSLAQYRMLHEYMRSFLKFKKTSQIE